jgi:hypothetical protein
MNTALLFSGQLRGFKHCVENLKKNLIEVFGECDSFMFLTMEDCFEEEYIRSVLNPKKIIFQKDVYFENAESIVGPHNICGAGDKKIQSNGYKVNENLQRYLLQWYGVKRVYEMMENFSIQNNKKYDYVIRLRCDANFTNPFNIKCLKENYINVPNFDSWYGIHDRFAVGNMENMKVYCNKFDYISPKMAFGVTNFNNSESRMKNYLYFNNIKINEIDFYYERLNKDKTIQP